MAYSDDNNFEKILERMLAQDILVNVDKRVGSIIYDALAPAAMELATAYQMIDILQEQTYLLTATGNNLDKRCADYGLTRMEATKAQRIGEFKQYEMDGNGNYVLDENDNKILVDMEIIEGTRFIVPESSITYEYIGIKDGHKILECEQAGIGGNEHTGTILPLTPINGLIEANIISTYKYGENAETDEQFRARAQAHINNAAYGGNIQDYIEKVNAIDGVGNTKVFPAWDYNGTVLLSVVDPSYNPISNEFAAYLKNIIDPDENTGEGYGIAPIGHYVTITTPQEYTIDVSLTCEIASGAEIGEVRQAITDILTEYFNALRRQFAQNINITIYRSRIITVIENNISSVLNIDLESVLLNNSSTDIILEDEASINGQYLPKLGTITVLEANQ